jgi:uncharacterized membrane protein
MWIAGINTKETSRALLGLAVVLLLVARRVPEASHLSGRTARLFQFFPLVFVPLLGIYQLVRVYLGEHGIDFAIFTQVIRSIRDIGVPVTSLVAPEPVNFFSHHFAPFFYLLGWCSRISLPPHVVGIVAQVISIGIGVYCFYRFCRALGFSAASAGVAGTLLCINPCFRSGVSWGIHDEVFAVGVIGVALYAWVSDRVLICAGCLLLLGLFKETFFIASALSAALACMVAYRTRGGLNRACWTYGMVALVMSIASLFYFVLIPFYPDLFKMSFKPAARVASLSSVLSPEFIGAKLSFLAYLLAPLLGLPLLSHAGALLWVCAAPFWGACLVSNFAEMHKAFNYYAVVPTYVAFFSAALTIRGRWGSQVSFTPLWLTLLTCLAFSSGYAANPLKPALKLLASGSILPDSLTMIPKGYSVVASEFDSIFVLDKQKVVRLWIAERVPTTWDVILVRDKSQEPPSAKMLRGSSLCYEDSLWKIYCRKGVSLN